jgi:hypothetical protein
MAGPRNPIQESPLKQLQTAMAPPMGKQMPCPVSAEGVAIHHSDNRSFPIQKTYPANRLFK